MNDKKLKEDLFGRLLGKQSIIEPILVDPTYVHTGSAEPQTFINIKSALAHVKKGGVIRLVAGVYRQNVEITVGDIKIQAAEPTSNVILINNVSPSVIINLENDKDIVHFESIKFAHSASGQQDMIQNAKQYNYMDDQVNIFQIGDNMNCIFLVKKGKVNIQQCKFSLNVLRQENKSIIPCIVVDKAGQLLLTRSQLFGTSNSSQSTIGILSKRGTIIIKQSTFIGHKRAALYLSGHRDTLNTISNCTIQKCSTGINLIGNYRAIIENNVIEECQVVGIKIGTCNRSKITYNTLRKNNIGIEFTNASPEISNNLISMHKKDGILSRTKELFYGGGQIKVNTIRENEQAGIRVMGSINHCLISGNSEISLNKKCGILVQNGAHPHIFKNIIEKNLGQGILVVQGSSAFIEKNEIRHNIKSNIAIGGKNSINTTIIGNNIHSGRCEGVFMIYGQKFMIMDNQISKNNQGIVSITSVPHIQGNTIEDNDSNGMLFIKDSRPTIINNLIKNNHAAGVFLRDRSAGRIVHNKFDMNKYEIIIENEHELLENVHKDNEYEGELRIPQNYSCSVM